FRAQRFQDWGTRSLGWRQMAELAGSGELADMLSHRIDFAHYLVGSIRQVVARLRRFLDKRGGAVSDVDDWVSMIIEFESGASGVLESSKLCTGTGEGPQSRDYCEINGSEGSLAYSTQTPLELRAAQKGANSFARMPVPDDLLKHPASTRNPRDGDPLLTFRYDQDAEFINAIIEDRPCVPSLMDGALAQAVMDAAIISSRERRWMELNSLTTSNH
ncbi:MAG: gfo/Idh/MocA family oxidoreductase, partial [Verrucomicrobia bacterium]|nr:gfo/Idh/MocA family oxidoreductase [Verrucomicrobiota bacterium]